MGTHMWTNTASRRGRRMSLELPLSRPLNISQQDAEFLQHRPELFYPYLPPPFLNGMAHKVTLFVFFCMRDTEDKIKNSQ